MQHPLTRLEAQVEALIEGTFSRWFSTRLHPKDLAIPLARALEDSAQAGTPATRYILYLHPREADTLLAQHPRVTDWLATEIVNLAQEAGLTLNTPPEIILRRDASRKLRTVQVVTETIPQDAQTQSMTPVRTETTTPRPLNAFLILDGHHTVTLTASLLNVGRRTDNDIIVDDARVSRLHAQLRLRFGRYVLYDLGSTSGTEVNGQRIQECVLRPGDVISLGGVLLIYGEDELPGSTAATLEAEGHTQPNP